MPSTYHFQYADDNVYGHAVRLVRAHGARSGVHLDVGCGFGAIAEPLRDLGLEYVGVDLDPDGVEDLRRRGFEAHVLDLRQVSALEPRLREILATRRLASMTMLDTLEHVSDDVGVMSALRTLVGGSAAPLVVSVPNVAHRDLGLKLVVGKWAYTETGLLDRTHVVHHTEQLIEAMALTSGWHQVGREDVSRELSDQHFPADSVVLSPATSVGAFLRQVRDAADRNARVVQFVRAYLAGPPRPVSLVADRDEPARPFLTVVLRTQGRRPATLRDALLSLTAQTCQDFEIVVVAHKVDVAQQISVERLIEELPAGIHARTRLVRVEHGGRAAPLNVAFSEAKGRYIAVLDDDDVVFGHWVEQFAAAGATAGGRVLRAVAIAQQVDLAAWGASGEGFRTVGRAEKIYPTHYDLFAHLTQNFSPLMCLAFPRGLFHELGFRFDERLDTCEDWDFEMRSALLCGVAAIPHITAVYRRWRTGHSSYTLHSEREWRENEALIVSKLDAMHHVFPPGTVRLIREQQAELRELRARGPVAGGLPGDRALPLRYRMADRVNSTIKRLPGVHRFLKSSLNRR